MLKSDCPLCTVVREKFGANWENDNFFVPYIVVRCRNHWSWMIVATCHHNPLSGSPCDIPPEGRGSMADAVSKAAADGTIDSGTWVVQQMSLKHQHGLADGHTRVHLTARDSYASYPQELADSIAMATQEAVQWFHDPSVTIRASWTELELIDDMVRERIKGFQLAMDREISRLSSHGWTEGWAWRLKPGWEEKHDEWIASFNEWIATPEGQKHVLDRNCWRYDLSALPFPMQRSLVSQWQSFREAVDRPENSGITVGDITLCFPKESAPEVSGYEPSAYYAWGPWGAPWGMPNVGSED